MENTVEEEVVSLFDESGNPTMEDTPVVEEVEVAETEVAETEEDSFEIPQKFQGKSLEDVVEAYTNLEKEHGRKANEVGELRALTDEILKQQVTQNSNTGDEFNYEVDDFDYFEDTSTAVDKALADNPTIKAMEQRIRTDNEAKSHAELVEVHPDADDLVASEEFLTWAQKSPHRIQQLQQAHRDLNVGVAADLLSAYKSTLSSRTEALEERDANVASDLKKATVERGRNKASSKPVFLRSELIRLKRTQPARYEKMRDEIMLAYSEKRVK